MKSITLSPVVAAAILATACTPSGDVTAVTETPPIATAIGRAAVVELSRPFEAGGVLRARYTASIASRVMAPVAAVHVGPGDRVTRGTPLVTLDARESAANRARAAGDYAAAAEAGRSAEADIQTAEAQLRLERVTHARIASLHAKRSATAQELDQAVAALAAAQAQLASAQARSASAAAARDAAYAAREAATIGASYSVLRAPFDGVVIERTVDPGAMAVPGVSLLTIEDPTLFRLELQLDEARANTVSVGQRVEYRFDSAIGEAWHPAVVAEVGRVDALSHAFLVKVDVAPNPMVRSGSFGRVRFPGPPLRTLAVPRAALVRRGQLSILFTVDPDGRARLRPVSTGIETSDLAEVLAGVNAGDRVVVNPPAGLLDGALVVPQ